MEQAQSDHVPNEVKVENFERSLLVPLTDKERSALADRQAFLLGEISDLVEERKNAAKQAQAEIDAKKAELTQISGEYRAGKKFSKVKCERRFFFRLGNYEEVRLDTNEKLVERGLTERERQLALPMEDAEPAGDNDSEAPESAPLPAQKRTRAKKGTKAS